MDIRYLIREIATELAFMKLVLDLILWARMRSAEHAQEKIRNYHRLSTQAALAKAAILSARQSSELKISLTLQSMQHEVQNLLATYKNLVILIAGTAMYKPRNMQNGKSRGRTDDHIRSLTDWAMFPALFPAAAIWTGPTVELRAENQEVIIQRRSVTSD